MFDLITQILIVFALLVGVFIFYVVVSYAIYYILSIIFISLRISVNMLEFISYLKGLILVIVWGWFTLLFFSDFMMDHFLNLLEYESLIVLIFLYSIFVVLTVIYEFIILPEFKKEFLMTKGLYNNILIDLKEFERFNYKTDKDYKMFIDRIESQLVEIKYFARKKNRSLNNKLENFDTYIRDYIQLLKFEWKHINHNISKETFFNSLRNIFDEESRKVKKLLRNLESKNLSIVSSEERNYYLIHLKYYLKNHFMFKLYSL